MNRHMSLDHCGLEQNHVTILEQLTNLAVCYVCLYAAPSLRSQAPAFNLQKGFLNSRSISIYVKSI